MNNNFYTTILAFLCITLLFTCKPDDNKSGDIDLSKVEITFDTPIIKDVLVKNGQQNWFPAKKIPIVLYPVPINQEIVDNKTGVTYTNVINCILTYEYKEYPAKKELSVMGDTLFILPQGIGGKGKAFQPGSQINIKIEAYRKLISGENTFKTDKKNYEINFTTTKLPYDFVNADFTSIPADSAKDMGLYTQPAINLKYLFNTPYQFNNDGTTTYTLKAKSYKMLVGNKLISGKYEISANNKHAVFQPLETLPESSEIKVILTSECTISTEGKPEKDYVELNSSFIFYTLTKKPPQNTSLINDDNIEYCYPISRQYNFLKDEYPQGYLKMRYPQDDITGCNNCTYKARLTPIGQPAIETELKYIATENKFTFDLPKAMTTQTIYKLDYVKTDNTTNSESVFYSIHFRTSIFNNFKEKADEIIKKAYFQNGNEMEATNLNEIFDSFELKNDSFTYVLNYSNMFDDNIQTGLRTYKKMAGLIRIEMEKNNKHFDSLTIPAIYYGYKNEGLALAWRDTKDFSVPPVEAIYSYSIGNLKEPIILTDEQVQKNLSKSINPNDSYFYTYFYFQLLYIMIDDYRNIIYTVSQIDENNSTEWMKKTNTVGSNVVDDWEGSGKEMPYNLRYVLPGEIETSNISVKFKLGNY